MKQPFSLSTARCAVLTDPALRAEIQTHTQSNDATDRILRSLFRFGVDSTIERFDVTPQANRAGARVTPGFAWSVKAVRAVPVDPLAPPA